MDSLICDFGAVPPPPCEPCYHGRYGDRHRRPYFVGRPTTSEDGRLRLESVVGFGWNAWSVSVGIGGRHQLEFMVGLGWNMHSTAKTSLRHSFSVRKRGNTLARRRSSSKLRSTRLVVRMLRRCTTGSFKCARLASKSSRSDCMADGYVLLYFSTAASASCSPCL